MYEGAQVLVDQELRAAYDLPGNRVFLAQPWDAAAAPDQSVLMHELIHALQLHNRDWECLQAPEWEAYELQDAWLAAQGVPSGFDWLHVYFLSRCPRDHHP